MSQLFEYLEKGNVPCTYDGHWVKVLKNGRKITKYNFLTRAEMRYLRKEGYEVYCTGSRNGSLTYRINYEEKCIII